MIAVPALAPAPDHVALTHISVQDFRNYPALALELEAALVVLTGPNGAGKTNLLESMSLLPTGGSLGRAAVLDMDRISGRGGWDVSAVVARNGAQTRLGTGTVGDPAGGERARKVRVNGAAASGPDVLLD